MVALLARLVRRDARRVSRQIRETAPVPTPLEEDLLGKMGILPFTRHPLAPERERMASKAEVAVWIENSEPRAVWFIRGKENA